MAGFYLARDRILPPLLWPSIAPPFTPMLTARREKNKMGNNNRIINGPLKVHILLCLLFIFAPIAGSFVFSLNSVRFPSLPLGDFSTEWYRLI